MLAKDRKIGEKNDLLNILLEMNDESGEKLEDKDIIDLLISLLFGGHDSIAAGMMLTIMYLTEHPLCLKKAKVNVLRLSPTKGYMFLGLSKIVLDALVF